MLLVSRRNVLFLVSRHALRTTATVAENEDRGTDGLKGRVFARRRPSTTGQDRQAPLLVTSRVVRADTDEQKQASMCHHIAAALAMECRVTCRRLPSSFFFPFFFFGHPIVSTNRFHSCHI